MVLNYIWVAFFVIAFIVALGKLVFLGDMDIFTELVNATFDSSKNAFEISLGLTGILALWLGIMKIGEQSFAGPDRYPRPLVGHYENRRAERHDRRPVALAQPRVLSPLPRHPQRTSGHG